MELRIRPKSTFLAEADWQELYVLTEYWQRDMRFYEDELHFLQNLADKYFIWLASEENIGRVQAMGRKLAEAEKTRKDVADRIDKHLAYLAELMKKPLAYNVAAFRNEHVRLEDDLAEFNAALRDTKQEIFLLTEHVIETEKLRQLL